MELCNFKFECSCNSIAIFNCAACYKSPKILLLDLTRRCAVLDRRTAEAGFATKAILYFGVAEKANKVNLNKAINKFQLTYKKIK